MRRHHFLALHVPEPRPDSVSLLIGAEADRERRGSSQIIPNPHAEVHRRLPDLFSEPDGEGSDTGSDEDEVSPTDESSPGFLGRVNSYNRLMHAHTKTQLQSPRNGTIPSYAKTMHAFTLNQLNDERRISRSETNSPQIAAKQVLLPAKVCNELEKLSLDELPHGPVNTPEHGVRRASDVQGIDFRKLKRRSVTEPITRDFAMVKARDFAAS